MNLITLLEAWPGSYITNIFIKDIDDDSHLYFRGTIDKFFDNYDAGDIENFISESMVLTYGRNARNELNIYI